MIPLRDDNPTELTPYVTYGVLGICVLVFLYQLGLGQQGEQRFIFEFGFIPALLFGNATPQGWTPPLPASATVLTSMFIHGGFMHIAGNMLYLWIFGNNVEDAVGHVRYVLFYVACGVAAALAQGFTDPSSTIPMVGASGAIGGVLGAYFLLYPKAQVLVLIPLGLFTQLVRIPALFVLGFWFVLQFFQGAMSWGAEGGGVAFFAHIGGFVAGMGLILVMRRPGVTLWHKRQPYVAGTRTARMPPRPPRGGSRIPDAGDTPHRRGPWGR